MSLLIETGRVNCFEVHLQQELKANDVWIILYMNRFSVARCVGIYFFISRIGCVSVREAHFCFHNSLDLLEIMFSSPEAATC